MNLSRNERREARERKHAGPDFYAARASGNHLVSQNDEPEPGELRLFRVLAVCGGRAVGKPLEVYGTDAMSVAKAHIGWAATEGYGAHPQVLPVEEPSAPLAGSDVFTTQPMDAREREQLRVAIQGETQADLMAGRGAAA